MMHDDAVARIQQEWARERPDVDASPQGIIGRLHRIATHLTAELATVFTEYGLSEGEFDLLASLRRAGAPYERGASDIAQHTMVTTGAITKRVDRLEKAGLVERRRDDTDGRGRRVRLTTAGLTTIDSAFTAHMANEHRLLGTLSAEDRRALEPLLARWMTTLEAEAQDLP